MTASAGTNGGGGDPWEPRRMRIGDYVVREDTNCWVVATIKTFLTGSQKGEEYESDVRIPGALRSGPQNAPRSYAEGRDRT